jgi:hypothetical protein
MALTHVGECLCKVQTLSAFRDFFTFLGLRFYVNRSDCAICKLLRSEIAPPVPDIVSSRFEDDISRKERKAHEEDWISGTRGREPALTQRRYSEGPGRV